MNLYQRKYINGVSLFIFCWVGVNIMAQECISENFTCKSGEEISYVIAYDWFVVWTEVGELTVSVKDTTYQGQPAFKYSGLGRTFKSWEWIFKLKDEFIGLIDKRSLKPFYSKREIREGRYRKYDNYQYNFEKMEAYTNVSRDNRTFKQDTVPIDSCTFDIMSALFYARNLDFAGYEPGDIIPITVLLDEESFPIYFRYMGIEDFKLKHVGTFECIKFRVMLVEGDMFKEGEHMTVWATNDKNRIVVYAETPILVGSIRARLETIKNNRYPLTSLNKKKRGL